MTGWYPHVRGHRTLWHCLRPHEPNTLKYLKRAGYDVHFFGKNDLLAAESYADSVTKVHRVNGGDTSRPSLCAEDEPGYMSFLFGPRSDHYNDYYQVQEAARFLRGRKNTESPFILNIALSLPHCPYTVQEPWYSMYENAELPPLRPSELEGKPDFHTLIRKYRRLDEVDEELFLRIRRVYYGMVSYVDSMLGILLDTLDETGLADNTAVFAFSDHGDWAGDYGLVEKWPSALDDCLTRVPLIIRTPDGAKLHSVNEQVELFDIMPTTLELAGIEAAHSHCAHSLTAQLKGAAGNPGRAVFAEGGYDRGEPHCFEGKPVDGVCADPQNIYYPKGLQQQQRPESVCRATMIRTLGHKLIRRPGGVSELYDLANDPGELRNVYDHRDYQSIQTELTGRLLDWYIHTSDVTPWDTDNRRHPE